ncbi:MAG: hypothetical protein K2L11_03295 [Muribaculaceae bacterium]|nr:hypothetical protein [Muribaculaceae bacterium]
MKLENLKDKFRDYISNQSEISILEEKESYFNFSSNGLIYVFETFEDDPYYFRMVLPNIFAIDDSNRDWLNTQIDDLSLSVKDARLIKNGSSVSAIADSFVYSPENIDYLFKRVLSCLVTIYNELKKNYINEFKSES